jgi:NAD(P)H dehydrogenase (quinone)
MTRKLIACLLLLVLSQIAAAADKIIISGASGQLGALVVDALLARKVAPADLILVSRTPDTEALKGYAKRGASVRFGDFAKPESLETAFRGGTRLLLISVSGGSGNRPELHKAAIDAAVKAGVKQIAYTSYVNADRYTTSMIGPDHRRTEVLLEQSGIAWTLLRNQIYANGLPDQAEQIVRDGKLVTFTPDARVAYVTREDCAAAAAAVLSTPGHDNKAYNITGPDAIGPRELVALTTEISGKRIELVVQTEDEYRRALRASGMADSAIDGNVAFAKELDSPYLREPSTAVADLTGKQPTSVRKLLEDNRARLRAAAQEKR